MIDTGLYLPLRFYHSLDEMTLNRKECEDFGHEEFFWCPEDYLLPFQVEANGHRPMTAIPVCDPTDTSSVSYSSIQEIVYLDGSTTATLYRTFLGGAVIIPSGLVRLSLTYPTETGIVAYSDPIYIGDVSDKIHLKYRDNGLQGDIYWREGFYAECYINSVIEKPTYPIAEETVQDGEGDMHRVFQKWDKRHKIRFFGVESMADAMSLLPTMDEVWINEQRVYDTLVDITWEDDRDCLAEIVITFSTKKLVKTF